MLPKTSTVPPAGRFAVDFRGAIARPFPEVQRLLAEANFTYDSILATRREIGRLSGTPESRILFARNTTEALSFARWLAEVDGGSVVLSDGEYPSVARIFREKRDHGNTRKEDDLTTYSEEPVREAWSGDSGVRPLNSVRVIRAPFLERYDPAEILDRVEADTRLVVLSHAVRSTGRIVDIEAFARALRERHPDLLLAVDGAFAFGNLPHVDFSSLEAAGVDFYAISPHKTLKSVPLGILLLGQRAAARIEKLKGSTDPVLFRGMVPDSYGALHSLPESLNPGRCTALLESLRQYRERGFLSGNDFSRKIENLTRLKNAFLERLGPGAILPAAGGPQLAAIVALRFPELDHRRLVEELRREDVACAYMPEIDGVRICFDVEHDETHVVAFCDRLDRVRRNMAAPNKTEAHSFAVADCPAPSSSVPEMFARQVAARGPATALIGPDASLTYDELDAYTQRIAATLLERKVTPGEIVAVGIPRSVQSVAAYLAILKCGAVYMPLHPGLPPERKRRMLSEAGVRLVCIDRTGAASDLADVLPAEAQVLELDGPRADEHPPHRPLPALPEVRPEDGAYVLYTSGSTGAPRGILVPHAGIERLLIQPNYFRPTPNMRMAHAANIAFDVSVFEIWGALLNGGTLVVVSETTAADPGDFAELIRSENINTLMLPPALLQLIATERPDAFSQVDELFYAGEPARPDFIARLLQDHPPRRLINGYGLTEISVLSTFFEIASCDGKTSIPIGGPIGGSRLYVLDEDLNPLGPDTAGELYIGGTGLADGYLGRPAMTAERFLPDPFGLPGGRMYRTGDVVMRDDTGQFIYYGRADRQIKIHGLRIEPGEIEHCLALHPEVDTAAVRVLAGASERIGAWVVPVSGLDGASRELLPERLREFIGARLPTYMIPARCFLLEAMPLSPNGKIDYRALPEDVVPARESNARGSSVAGGSAQRRRPASATEAVLVWLIAEALDLQEVGPNDNFLELGGDSLGAIRLSARIREELGVRPALDRILLAGTAENLARDIESGRVDFVRTPNVDGSDAPVHPPGPASRAAHEERGRASLTSAQRRVWFLERIGAGSAYHIPLAFHLSFSKDRSGEIESLRATLRAVVRRQGILRTRFDEHEGDPFQQELTLDEYEELLRDAGGFLAESAIDEEALQAELERRIERPFELGRLGGLRAELLHTGPDTAVLLIVMHHLVEDGWSVGVLLREIEAHFTALQRASSPPLPPVASYVERARSQPSFAPGDLERLIKRFQGLRGTELPTDHARPESLEIRGAETYLRFDAETTRALREFNQRQGATMFQTLQALFWLWLYRLNQQHDDAPGSSGSTLLTATQIAGRDDVSTHDMIGFFADIRLMRGDVHGTMSFIELVETARAAAVLALDTRVPYEALAERLGAERGPGRNPGFNLGYFHQEAMAMHPRLDLPGMRVEPWPVAWRRARMDLELHTFEENDRLHARSRSVRREHHSLLSRSLHHIPETRPREATRTHRRNTDAIRGRPCPPDGASRPYLSQTFHGGHLRSPRVPGTARCRRRGRHARTRLRRPQYGGQPPGPPVARGPRDSPGRHRRRTHAAVARTDRGLAGNSESRSGLSAAGSGRAGRSQRRLDARRARALFARRPGRNRSRSRSRGQSGSSVPSGRSGLHHVYLRFHRESERGAGDRSRSDAPGAWQCFRRTRAGRPNGLRVPRQLRRVDL